MRRAEKESNSTRRESCGAYIDREVLLAHLETHQAKTDAKNKHMYIIHTCPTCNRQIKGISYYAHKNKCNGGSCDNCGSAVLYAKGLCKACYCYKQVNNRSRPKKLLKRKTCKRCGKAGRWHDKKYCSDCLARVSYAHKLKPQMTGGEYRKVFELNKSGTNRTNISKIMNRDLSTISRILDGKTKKAKRIMKEL